ncbi:UxaA family hydrolase [Roseateles sp. BYS180W]|uniref:UxaA family hydrolase n=1 Tax=Roseateles rivi TaxID=3299028 RepID=A0ABW7FWD0_9BURK
MTPYASPRPTLPDAHWQGWLRADGRKGIRNVLAVVYLVECAHHVARDIVTAFREQDDGPPVHLIGFPGCYPNTYAQELLEALLTHPNVGGALLVSLGCEGFNKHRLEEVIKASGRPVHTLTIQRSGGTNATIGQGRSWVAQARQIMARQMRVSMGVQDLVIGTVCGGSDGTSGITANPAVGRAFDSLIAHGARCIFEETGELVGCEPHMAARARSPELAEALTACVAKAARYYSVLGHGSFAPGNADGGLTTQEEKSMGAYAKSGASLIDGIITPGTPVPETGRGGLYLLDVVPDGEVRWGFPNISDTAEIVELISCGAHMTLFTTGRGSVVGSAISPVIKVCANPDTYARMSEDMDVNAGRILQGHTSLDEVGAEIVQQVLDVASGRPSLSEVQGHQEFLLGYKYFDPSARACLA